MHRGLVACLLSLSFLPTAFATIQPVCDVNCTPDPGGLGYNSVVKARPMPPNGRGSSGIFPTSGSQSYNYAIPIVRLPGRNGLDLNLTLQYNSRIWTIDNANSAVTFNADRDFPSYGFRLDFGFLEYDNVDDLYVLTEADGTKRRLINAGNGTYTTDDSSYVVYNPANKTLTYKNGRFVVYEVFTSQAGSTSPTLFRLTKIEDTSGNFISIGYVSGKDQAIQQITDTLGRVVTFNYNVQGMLSSITQGTKKYADFAWTAIAFNYSFTGLTAGGTRERKFGECPYGLHLRERYWLSFHLRRLGNHSKNRQ